MLPLISAHQVVLVSDFAMSEGISTQWSMILPKIAWRATGVGMSPNRSRWSGATRSAGLVAIAILAPGPPAFVQDEMTLEPSHTLLVGPEFHDRVEVHVGTIDITVVRKGGQVVTGLTTKDSVLLVDGQPAKVSNSSAFGSQQPESAEETSSAIESTPPPMQPLPEPRPQLMVAFIDNENISRCKEQKNRRTRLCRILDEISGATSFTTAEVPNPDSTKRGK
jgi:hypothetical protein